MGERQPAFMMRETMAAARSPDAGFGPGEIIDAEYITLYRPEEPVMQVASHGAPPVGIDVLRREETPPPFASRGSAGFWLLGLGLAAASFWIAGGHALISPPVN